MTKVKAIAHYYRYHPNATRREVANAVGCSVSHVAGCVQQGRTHGKGRSTRGAKTSRVKMWIDFGPEAPVSAIAEAAGCTPQLVYRIRRERSGNRNP